MANNLTQWTDPFAGLTTMHTQLDDLFNGFFSNAPTLTTHTATPMDVYVEDDKQLVVEAHLSGFGKNDVEVDVHNGVLQIKGEKHEHEESNKDKKRSYVVRESHASFYRSVALPKYADSENVTADFKNGVLKVIVPFKELPQPKRVQIGDGRK